MEGDIECWWACFGSAEDSPGVECWVDPCVTLGKECGLSKPLWPHQDKGAYLQGLSSGSNETGVESTKPGAGRCSTSAIVMRLKTVA